MNRPGKLPALLVFLLFASVVFAQTSEKIIMLDEYNALPIPGITYQYGSQQGISDENGMIAFRLLKGEAIAGGVDVAPAA